MEPDEYLKKYYLESEEGKAVLSLYVDGKQAVTSSKLELEHLAQGKRYASFYEQLLLQ